MPVLDRFKGESILIGDDIKITFLGRKGDEVRIGIQAPRHIKIIRSELKPFDDVTNPRPTAPSTTAKDT